MKIWLKMHIQAPKIYVFGGFDPQMLLFIVKTPKRHFLGWKHAFWALTGRCTMRGATGTLSKEYKNKRIKKGSPECTARIWVFAQTPPVNWSLPNFARGFRVPEVFLSSEFQKDRKKNVGAVGVEIFLLPLKRHIRLYNCLLLPHKPWFNIETYKHG